MVVLRYRPGKHEKGTLQHFGEKACKADGYGGDIPAGRSTFLCFTNRSGSNFVANCLVSTGNFDAISECFNAPIVINQSRKLGFTSFPEYCAAVKRKMAGQGGAFAAKVSWNQLFFLRRLGLLDSIFEDPRYVLIRRRDLVAQAVSKSIAVQTRRFKSSHPDKGIEPKYDFRDIAGTIRSITTSNGIFMEFFAVTGAPYFEIVYEDFVADPAAHTERLCRWLSLPATAMNDEKIGLRVQRNELNEAFQRRFVEDMKAATVDIGRGRIAKLLAEPDGRAPGRMSGLAFRLWRDLWQRRIE
ncbi:Stf0 family sulfotransferase [Parvibaculum sp.]|jgi:LPS sulfotransferase NodH|uniref:Stf0 family sulfotransferase n=1 Tax=Parvibaculum sp. TaxID=2024848 RepID=UPI001B0189BC|nr:Stf0 family sulfotransferase [Parvibaculum sp.]MBO6635495.1 sulfotransferase [Parvibaculum sp.]MBO6678731.1 sulfotransferase [Parvibaculum sp.]MBO6685366.1 sulfotransferase [Parvibaculum sp.]MBO6905367.1 sulfotransferase [Parvibaculum sp.]